MCVLCAEHCLQIRFTFRFHSIKADKINNNLSINWTTICAFVRYRQPFTNPFNFYFIFIGRNNRIHERVEILKAIKFIWRCLYECDKRQYSLRIGYVRCKWFRLNTVKNRKIKICRAAGGSFNRFRWMESAIDIQHVRRICDIDFIYHDLSLLLRLQEECEIVQPFVFSPSKELSKSN